MTNFFIKKKKLFSFQNNIETENLSGKYKILNNIFHNLNKVDLDRINFNMKFVNLQNIKA